MACGDAILSLTDNLKYFDVSRIITSDWGLADWVQGLIGSNRVCYASEVSRVDPANRVMEMHSKNLTFCR